MSNQVANNDYSKEQSTISDDIRSNILDFKFSLITKISDEDK